MFQEYDYTIGQPNRGPTTTADRWPRRGLLGLSSDAKNYTATLAGNTRKPDDNCSTGTRRLRQSHRERSGQDLQQPHHDRRRRLPLALPATTFPAASAISAATDRYRRRRRQQHVALRFRRLAQRADLRLDAFNDMSAPTDRRGNSNVITPGGERTVSGGFVAVEEELFHAGSRSSARCVMITTS